MMMMRVWRMDLRAYDLKRNVIKLKRVYDDDVCMMMMRVYMQLRENSHEAQSVHVSQGVGP